MIGSGPAITYAKVKKIDACNCTRNSSELCYVVNAISFLYLSYIHVANHGNSSSEGYDRKQRTNISKSPLRCMKKHNIMPAAYSPSRLAYTDECGFELGLGLPAMDGWLGT